MKNTFSIIVAVYNNASKIQNCIDSFVSQNYKSKELIVIDGGSTDGTKEIIERNASEISYWESKSDRGIYHAFNKGVQHASGDFILFLGSDDCFWDSFVLSKVESRLDMIEENIRLVYGKVAIVSPNDKILQIGNNSWEKSKRLFYQYCNIYHQGVFHRRDMFSNNSYFDESFKIAGDYDLMLRELRIRDAYFLSDIEVSRMQIGGVSSSPKKYIEIYREFYRARNKNLVKGFPYILFYFILTAYVRILLINVLGESNSDKLADVYRRITRRPSLWTNF